MFVRERVVGGVGRSTQRDTERHRQGSPDALNDHLQGGSLGVGWGGEGRVFARVLANMHFEHVCVVCGVGSSTQRTQKGKGRGTRRAE